VADATAREVGEFGLIALVVARLGTGPQVLLGPGDDAAVVAAPDGRVVVTTDVLVEGVHFRRQWSSGYDVGRKAAAANLADVMAMGGTGTALLVGLSTPPDLPLDWALALADGLRDEATVVGAVVVGGDITRGEQVVVSVTALGDLGGRAPVRRSGARPGDVVVVAGCLGHAAAGLERLAAGERSGQFVDAQRRPSPPYALGPVLADLGATAMCDVSDGLVADAGHLARASGVVLRLHSGRLVDDAVPLRHVLHGGEDHALLATVPAATALPAGCRAVGRVSAGDPAVLVDGAPAPPGGWTHF
jgi:thiamine-monophosphate kinase